MSSSRKNEIRAFLLNYLPTVLQEIIILYLSPLITGNSSTLKSLADPLRLTRTETRIETIWPQTVTIDKKEKETIKFVIYPYCNELVAFRYNQEGPYQF